MIDSFLADERAHIACFTRLRTMTGFADRFFTPPADLKMLAHLAGWQPRLFCFWPSVVAAFEQYALDIAKLYNSDDTLDPLFRDAFIAHARDEARHCRLDALLDAFLAPGLSTRVWLHIFAAPTTPPIGDWTARSLR